MKPIETKDGSVTFYNEQFHDIYKSVSGAVEEAREKFVKPCNILALAKEGEIKILDVCFGIGYNTLLAISEARKINPHVKIHIVALENDPLILEQILKVDMHELAGDYVFIQEAVKAWQKGKVLSGDIVVEFIVGDALQTIKEIEGHFDAVFLDPFTPRTCPHLWAADFIKDIAACMKEGSIIATYSCARMVRDNLAAAGLDVKEGPCIGRCAPSTFAIKGQKV